MLVVVGTGGVGGVGARRTMFVAVGVGVGGLIACWRATGALLAGAIRRFEAPVWIGIRIFCLSIGWRFWPDGASTFVQGKREGTCFLLNYLKIVEAILKRALYPYRMICAHRKSQIFEHDAKISTYFRHLDICKLLLMIFFR